MTGPEVLQLTKTEGQVWLSLYNLLMNPECLKKYDLNSLNKAQLLKVSLIEMLKHNLRQGCANIFTGGPNTINHVIPRAAPLYNIP